MSRDFDKAVRDLAKAIQKASDKKTTSYDTQAVVTKVEGDTVWVHIDGGVDETPIKKTIDAKKGDKVQVRVANGTAWLTGNYTAPPTDGSGTAEKIEIITQRLDNYDQPSGPSIVKIVTQYCASTSDSTPFDSTKMVTSWLDHVPTQEDIDSGGGGGGDDPTPTPGPSPEPEPDYEEELYETSEDWNDEYQNGKLELPDTVSIISMTMGGVSYSGYTLHNAGTEDAYLTFASGFTPDYPIVIRYTMTTSSDSEEDDEEEVQSLSTESNSESESEETGSDETVVYYIWMRTICYMSDDTQVISDPVYMPGLKQGDRFIIREAKEYCLATAMIIPAGGSFDDIKASGSDWSETLPDLQEDTYYWSRMVYYYSDGTVAYSDPVYDYAAKIAQEVIEAEVSIDNHFWSDSSGAYVGHVAGEKNQGSVLRAVSEGLLLTKNGDTMAAFTQSGMTLYGDIGNGREMLATYTNAGVAFNTSIPFTIGDPLSSCIQWYKDTSVNPNKWKIKIQADEIEMGGAPIPDPEDIVIIGDVDNYYLATNAATGVTKSTSGWTTTVQSMDSSKPYLWNYEVVKDSNGGTISSTDPVVIGRYGSDGGKGDTGNNGRGILNITEYYQKSTSNSTAPSTWSTTVPTLTATDKYLWNYEVITYDDNTTESTAKRVIGVYGDKGNDGVGVSSVTEYYQKSSSNSTAPSSWQTTVPTLTATDKYLWNYEKITYSNNTTEETAKRVIGVYGDKGNDGVSISSITEYYQRSTSNSTAPSSWQTTVPTLTATYKYLWNYEKITYSNNTTEETAKRVIGVYGDKGDKGDPGTDVTSVYVTANPSGYSGLFIHRTSGRTPANDQGILIGTSDIKLYNSGSVLATFGSSSIDFYRNGTLYAGISNGLYGDADAVGYYGPFLKCVGGDNVVGMSVGGSTSTTSCTASLAMCANKSLVYNSTSYEHNADFLVVSYRDSYKVGIGLGSGGTNRGVLDFITDTWIIYHNSDNVVAPLVGANTVASSNDNYYVVRSTTGGTLKRTSSSRRYKKDIEDISDPYLNPEKLYDLRVVQFRYKDDYKENKNNIASNPTAIVPGFIAEEVLDCYPVAALLNDNGQAEDWNDRNIVPPMLKLIQDQKQKIDSLTERIEILERSILND